MRDATPTPTQAANAPVAAPAGSEAPAAGEAAATEAAPAEAAAGGKIAYNSYQSDPEPRAWIEGTVADWNAANPDKPVDMSIIAHEDFKQALRAMPVSYTHLTLPTSDLV